MKSLIIETLFDKKPIIAKFDSAQKQFKFVEEFNLSKIGYESIITIPTEGLTIQETISTHSILAIYYPIDELEIGERYNLILTIYGKIITIPFLGKKVFEAEKRLSDYIVNPLLGEKIIEISQDSKRKTYIKLPKNEKIRRLTIIKIPHIEILPQSISPNCISKFGL